MNETEALASQSNCDDRLSDSNCFFLVTAFSQRVLSRSECVLIAAAFSQLRASLSIVCELDRSTTSSECQP